MVLDQRRHFDVISIVGFVMKKRRRQEQRACVGGRGGVWRINSVNAERHDVEGVWRRGWCGRPDGTLEKMSRDHRLRVNRTIHGVVDQREVYTGSPEGAANKILGCLVVLPLFPAPCMWPREYASTLSTLFFVTCPFRGYGNSKAVITARTVSYTHLTLPTKA